MRNGNKFCINMCTFTPNSSCPAWNGVDCGSANGDSAPCSPWAADTCGPGGAGLGHTTHLADRPLADMTVAVASRVLKY